jgi:hypothetical protein
MFTGKVSNLKRSSTSKGIPMLVMMVACNLLSFRKNELTREGPISKNVPATIPTYMNRGSWSLKNKWARCLMPGSHIAQS